jgi:DNA-directed RNA polymerase subunit M/transcription elongation factor TFIIS
MWIRFNCPNGHHLKVPSKQAGRRAQCPKCKSTTRIPAATAPAAQIENSDLTDTGIMRILETGPAPESPTLTNGTSESATKKSETKNCPRCKTSLSTNMRVCDRCQLYLGFTDSVWDKALSQIRDIAG